MSADLKRGTKDNSRKKGVSAAWKVAKRQEAEARNADYRKLTPAQKLSRLDTAGLTATKERAKIQKTLQGAKNA